MYAYKSENKQNKKTPAHEQLQIKSNTQTLLNEEIRHSINGKYTSDSKELDERPNLSSDVLFVLSILLEHGNWDKKNSVNIQAVTKELISRKDSYAIETQR